MGITNFTENNDDDDDNNGNSSNNGGNMFGPSSGSGMPHMGPPGYGSGDSDEYDKDEALNYLTNFNKKYKNADPIHFRENVIQQLTSTLLGYKKANALLIGPAGTGKTAIAQELGRLIEKKDPIIPAKMHDHTIYEVEITAMMAGTVYRGMLEARLNNVMKFLADPDNKAIAFVDEIHMILGGSNNEDSTHSKIAQQLKPALSRNELRMIGATTLQEAKAFDNDPAFNRRFSTIIVDELTREQTQEIVLKVRDSYIQHYGYEITVSDDVIPTLCRIADEESKAGSHRPDNALTLLDRAMADALITKTNAGIPAPIPLRENSIHLTAMRLMTGNAQRNVLDTNALAKNLGEVRGQSKALNTIMSVLVRDYFSITPRNKPLTMMFAGPSGVGKTETAKIIAHHVTDTKPIVLNMAEYKDEWMISKIIGSPKGYVGSTSNTEMPFDILESNPYQVIILDEIEKSAPGVQRLFLSGFDEGYIKTSLGKIVDFSKAIFIATTNAGRDEIGKQSIGFGQSDTTDDSRRLTASLEKVFDPEFLGRFSLITPFEPLSNLNYADIITDTYRRQVAKIKDRKPWLDIPDEIDTNTRNEIANRTYVKTLGARPAIRAVQQHIEDLTLAAQNMTAQFEFED